MRRLCKPRWPGGPPICTVTNLPAFESPQSLDTFRETNAPGGHIIAQWKCTACGLWHYWGGHGMAVGKNIDEARDKFLKSDVAKTMP